MIILVAENPGRNSYISSLIKAYQEKEHTVVCGRYNFFNSNLVPDLLHIHWPEKLFQWAPLSEKPDKIKIQILESRLKWYREKGTVIVFTVHNVSPYKSNNTKRLDENLFNLIVEYSNIISHHCENSIEYFKKIYPSADSKINIVIHHGDYLADYKFMSKISAREKINIPTEKFVILSLRSQQEYRGETFVKTVFNSCKIDSKYLLIAGNYNYSGISNFKKSLLKVKNYLRMRSTYKNKKYLLRAINEDELALLFSAADIVFLGHSDAMVSGIIAMAATFKKPVIYPDVGCFKEQVKNWVSLGYEAGNIYQACKALNDIYGEIINDNVLLDNSAWLIKNSWEKHAEKIINEANKLVRNSL